MKLVFFILLIIIQGNIHGQAGKVLGYSRLSYQKSGFNISVDSVDEFGKSSAFLGDLDNDGKPEVFVAGRDGQTLRGLGYLISLNKDGSVFRVKLLGRNHGLANNATPTWYSFGWSSSCIGDINKDGINDLAVGNPGESGYGGDFFIIFLNANGSIKNYKLLAPGKNGFNGSINSTNRFGNSIISIGDIDKNGTTELVVGAPYTSDGASEAGAIWILSINDTGYCTKYQKISHTMGGASLGINASITRFGTSLCSYKDINNDTISEFFVGAAFAKINGISKGKIYGISLNNAWNISSFKIISDTSANFGDTLPSPCFLGISIGNFGDVDGNGFDDIGVGSPVNGPVYPHGQVRLLLMKSNWLIESTVKWDSAMNGCPPITYGGLFGYGISGIGDVNGDGKLDAFVGSPGDGLDYSGYGAGHVFFLDGKVYTNTSKIIIKPELKMYPNPSKGGSDIKVEIPISMADQETQCSILNALGQVVYETEIEKHTILYTLEDVAIIPGFYTLVIRNKNEIYSNKILIE